MLNLTSSPESIECSPYKVSLIGEAGVTSRGELRLVSESADSDRGRCVDEEYDDPRRSSMPLSPPDRLPAEGLVGRGNPRESV